MGGAIEDKEVFGTVLETAATETPASAPPRRALLAIVVCFSPVAGLFIVDVDKTIGKL